MAHTGTVTKKLRAKGLPVELVRGDGYHYFVFDDPARNIYETESIMTMQFGSFSEERWIEMGEEFAREVEERFA